MGMYGKYVTIGKEVLETIKKLYKKMIIENKSLIFTIS